MKKGEEVPVKIGSLVLTEQETRPGLAVLLAQEEGSGQTAFLFLTPGNLRMLAATALKVAEALDRGPSSVKCAQCGDVVEVPDIDNVLAWCSCRSVGMDGGRRPRLLGNAVDMLSSETGRPLVPRL